MSILNNIRTLIQNNTTPHIDMYLDKNIYYNNVDRIIMKNYGPSSCEIVGITLNTNIMNIDTDSEETLPFLRPAQKLTFTLNNDFIMINKIKEVELELIYRVRNSKVLHKSIFCIDTKGFIESTLANV